MSDTEREILGPGTTLGHFEILGHLGSGGMGSVYRARDMSLDRPVALKILSDDLFRDGAAKARFLREAHLASLLVHPNVATIHEMNEVRGVLFIAMELVPGRNLKQALQSGPLALSEVISVGAQVSEALIVAHRTNIVHRDIKSSNIMLTSEGLVKVLDFGLAKPFAETPQAALESDRTPYRSAEPPGSFSSDGATLQGIALGTPSYMSPEQASGLTVDERSDIFSLGVVLFEAATGELPFKGGTEREVLDAVRHADPLENRSALGLPEGFLRILSKCLAKKPEERYDSARAVREDLERLGRRARRRSWSAGSRARLWIAFGAGAAVLALLGIRLWWQPWAVTYPSIRTFGVLPFENVSGNPEENYLAAAVPLELISRLGQIPTLKVVPWTFMARFREKSTSLGQIRQESGADAVLEGAVTLVPDESTGARTLVRIQTQLFDTRTGVLIWSDSVERDLGSFFRLRGEIAQQIATLVQVQLDHREMLQITSARDVDPEAMALYLHGREALEHREQYLSQAAEYLEAAVAKSPQFAQAHVALADAYVLLSAYLGVMGAERAYELSVGATKRALEIDDTLGEAWATQAFAHYVLAWDFAKAEEEFTRAISLSPHSAEVRHWYADFLSAMGRHPEALVHSRLAESRSPLSAPYSRDVAWSFFFARRYDEAIGQLRKTLEKHPDFVPARTLLGRALVQKGLYEEGIAELRAVGDSYSAMLAQAYATAGRREEAKGVLKKLLAGETSDPRLPYMVALVYAALGDADKAFESLETAFRVRDPTLVSLKTDPLLDSLRADARFENLLRRMHFPP